MAIWIVQFILVVAFVVAVFLMFCADRKFNESWPPIDDDEFLRRCSPGTNRETALKVRRIVSENLGVDYGQVYPEQSFVDDLDCD